MINLTQDKLENLKEQSTESRTLNNKSVKSLNKVRPDANQDHSIPFAEESRER